jgi:ketosteroid isomerase-like protein
VNSDLRDKEADRSASPIDVVGHWLQNLMDPDVVHRVVAEDATYVSLNTENDELNRILPWAGTSRGPQAILDNLGAIFARWENQGFNVTTMFGADENVAVFGDFRYKSNSLGKIVTSPFAILVKVVDGKVTYVQFLEDSYATARSFRKDGSWTVQTEAGAQPFEVGASQ